MQSPLGVLTEPADFFELVTARVNRALCIDPAACCPLPFPFGGQAISGCFGVERNFVVGAGAKLDRDGSKLDSGDGAKLDFCRIALETTGVEVISSESRPSSAGYGSAGGQPERWTLPKGLIPRCCGTAYPGPRHSSQEAHWPNAENSGGLGAAPPWLKVGEGTRLSRYCPACKETTHSSPAD